MGQCQQVPASCAEAEGWRGSCQPLQGLPSMAQGEPETVGFVGPPNSAPPPSSPIHRVLSRPGPELERTPWCPHPKRDPSSLLWRGRAAGPPLTALCDFRKDSRPHTFCPQDCASGSHWGHGLLRERTSLLFIPPHPRTPVCSRAALLSPEHWEHPPALLLPPPLSPPILTPHPFPVTSTRASAMR